MLSAKCTAPRLKLVVLTHPWTKLYTHVRVAQRLFWDAMTLLLISLIKATMGTIALFLLNLHLVLP